MRLGILGGSFNPIHHGHLLIATFTAEALKLDRVLFIPTAISPLKDIGALAPARDRWTMLKLAIKGRPRFKPCDLEIRRGGVSYTVDTLSALRRLHPVRPYLILGADAFRLVPHWKDLDKVRSMVRFVAVERPGHKPMRGGLKPIRVPVPLLEISGTLIRARARQGLPLRSLVPEAVERHILRRGLYRR